MDLKEIIETLAAAETCPLGPGAISGYHKAEREFELLVHDIKMKVMRRIQRINAPYFRVDENGMSGADYDQLMMRQ